MHEIGQAGTLSLPSGCPSRSVQRTGGLAPGVTEKECDTRQNSGVSDRC